MGLSGGATQRTVIRACQKHPFLDFVAVLAINSAAAIKLSQA